MTTKIERAEQVTPSDDIWVGAHVCVECGWVEDVWLECPGKPLLADNAGKVGRALELCGKHAAAWLEDHPEDGLALAVRKIVEGKLGPLRSE